ncbi:prepilin-type N-terminal cleavage/methylation domain-containing protein [Opitutaceae bacterium TAV4]|nr:prepilin-type N-terminal cleavage/methylation domain-containing protein [Opitutaceae bacterium TAV4]RRK01820.1 prepilin-type N-terminal cleavage/methylation domain-containing protein [Opitutaceae bacterium TAV3]
MKNGDPVLGSCVLRSATLVIGNGRAFTLVELLTVIAIIGILAGILIPTVATVREKGRTAACMSNLRQVGISLTTYAADNKGRLPVQNWWTNAAPPSLAINGSSTDPAVRSNGLGFLVSYGYLGGAGGVSQLVGLGKPQVLRCPNDRELFFNKPGASNWCSYVYQSPHPTAAGGTDAARPNTIDVVVSQMALVVDAAQVFANNPPAHGGQRTAVLYGGGQVMLRPWRGSNGLSLDSQPRNFDLAAGLRN